MIDNLYIYLNNLLVGNVLNVSRETIVLLRLFCIDKIHRGIFLSMFYRLKSSIFRCFLLKIGQKRYFFTTFKKNGLPAPTGYDNKWKY